MQKQLIILLLTAVTFSFCNTAPTKENAAEQFTEGPVLKVEMNLSAFGVESDDFPSIAAYIDFMRDSSCCAKSYYNPAYKGSVYHLSGDEIKKVLALLQNADLEKLKTEYTVNLSDQPTSTITIYTAKRKFIIKDYGLQGEYPLQELYKIVYKL